MKKLITSSIIGLGLLVTSAQADIVKCKVTHTKPILKTVTHRVPQSSITEYQVPVYRTENCGSNYVRNSNNDTKALLGAIIGGAVGHQIGGGSGKALATGMGAIIGAKVGGSGNNNSYSRVQKSCKVLDHYEIRTSTKTTYTNEYETIISGYKSYFIYNGQEYVKIADTKLDYVNVRTKTRISY